MNYKKRKPMSFYPRVENLAEKAVNYFQTEAREVMMNTRIL